MRAFREQDFDKMAERVVDHFMGGGKLADAATQEAVSGELNPDQIARLVHAANTMAFLRLMDQQKSQGGADMTGEFDPIDAQHVIQQLIGSVDVPHMDAPPPAAPAGDEGPLPDEMGARRAPPSFGEGEAMQAKGDDAPKKSPPIADDNDGPFPKGEKQKTKDDAEKKDKKEPPKESKSDTKKEAAFLDRRRRKFADVLEDQYRQAEWAFEDAMTRLGACLRHAHGAPTMDAFEKDALALHGDDFGIVVLNIVRGDRGFPPLEFDDARAKVAALADRHIVEDTEATRLFDQLVKIASEAAKLQQGAARVRSLCS
jgi:hypothetical protein